MDMVQQLAAGTTGTEVELNARCHPFAWTPEVHTFYGDAEAILAKIDTIDMRLSERRMFLLTVETAGSAEIRLFEQVAGTSWSVSSWTGESLGRLSDGLHEAILGNQGVFCVGEQSKGVLVGQGFELTPEGLVPAPHSARAAFAHPIREHGAETFTRATAALLC
jgi:hypothetical protein